ncbi:MAG: NAD-dependent epimerase/dehydratase family protein [Lentimicrobium sp.]|nr:NAD-dependent epimerase/dehydratase family protein [Lentimicrobium sp.]
MKIFISGATGFIGSHLALRLADEGHKVHALYRNETAAFVLRHPNIRLFKGDILTYKSLEDPVKGCSQIYHTAAYAKVYHKDIKSIYRLNIEGTMNVVRAGINAGADSIVCTSTAGVLGASDKVGCCDENTARPKNYFIDYECSKAIMEEALKTVAASGTRIIIVNPTRVYGPGVLSDSNGVTRIMQRYMAGKWRVIPGNGSNIGNYVYVDDVVTGHILAMEKGKSGESYLLGGSNLTYDEFFLELALLTGKKYAMFHIPLPLAGIVAKFMLLLAGITGGSPLITPSLVRKYLHHWCISSEKASRELNYQPADFKTGAGLTFDWLRKNK